jgi:outer membrane protein assembly factor BamD
MLRPMYDALTRSRDGRHLLVVLALIASGLASVLTGACAAKSSKVPPGTNQPDKFLFERGTEQLQKRKWVAAREYFQTLVETYPQSPYRADAKLGVGDCYLGEGTASSQVQALQEFHEFLSFFPTNPRADYAQYKLGMAHYYQMAKPERDQSETRHAIEEFDTFFARYPNSKLMPEARQHYREVRDRLSDSEYRIGLFYHKTMKFDPAAIDRFTAILKSDPQFTRRDAVYYYLAEAYVKMNRPAEALPQLQKLVDEFVQSEYLAPGQKLMAEVRAKGLETPPSTNAQPVTPQQPKGPEPKKAPGPAKPGKPPQSQRQ